MNKNIIKIISKIRYLEGMRDCAIGRRPSNKKMSKETKLAYVNGYADQYEAEERAWGNQNEYEI